MRTILAIVVLVLVAPNSALSTQHSALSEEFELIRKIAAHKDADADPETAQAAFEEAIADAVVSRLYGTPTMVVNVATASPSTSLTFTEPTGIDPSM